MIFFLIALAAGIGLSIWKGRKARSTTQGVTDPNRPAVVQVPIAEGMYPLRRHRR